MVVHDPIQIPSIIKSKLVINIQTIKNYKSNLLYHPLHSDNDSDSESLTDCDSFSSLSSESPVIVIQSSPTTDISLCSISSQTISTSNLATTSLRNSLSSTASVPSLSPASVSSSPSTSVSSPSLSSSLLTFLRRRNSSTSLSSSNSSSNDRELTSSSPPLPSMELPISSVSSSSSYFSVTPRMTDDHVPPVELIPAEEELTTFSISLPDSDHFDANLFLFHFRNRDSRINCQFLRLYAMDYHARWISKTLPNSAEDLHNCVDNNPLLSQFHTDYNLQYISGSSKNKLWNQVILPPRADNIPAISIDSLQYVCLGDNIQGLDDSAMMESSSLIRQSGECLPWHVLKPCLKPAGLLPLGKVMCNGLSPSSGITRSQYTMKGWVNKRWIPQTVE